mmetsp:Transcript_22483/g.44916  ORF Transcript_22483/g.44916 Transcript_22483/m.44916 type:complete len:398 (-) Transcript_22483:142-1335(-)
MASFSTPSPDLGALAVNPQELSSRLRSVTLLEVNPKRDDEASWSSAPSASSNKRCFSSFEKDDSDNEDVPCLKSTKLSKQHTGVRTCMASESFDRIMILLAEGRKVSAKFSTLIPKTKMADELAACALYQAAPVDAIPESQNEGRVHALGLDLHAFGPSAGAKKGPSSHVRPFPLQDSSRGDYAQPPIEREVACWSYPSSSNRQEHSFVDDSPRFMMKPGKDIKCFKSVMKTAPHPEIHGRMGTFELIVKLSSSLTLEDDAITLVAAADGASILRQMEAAKMFLRPRVGESDLKEGLYIDVVVFEIERIEPTPCRASTCCTGYSPSVVSPHVSDTEEEGGDEDRVVRNLTVKVYSTTKLIPRGSDLNSADTYIHYVYKVGGKPVASWCECDRFEDDD